jgi:hypothetical protein
MIKLTRKRGSPDVPTDFQGKTLLKKHVELLGRYYDGTASGRPTVFSSAKWKSAKAKLRNDTTKKCAYCETPTAKISLSRASRHLSR